MKSGISPGSTTEMVTLPGDHAQASELPQSATTVTTSALELEQPLLRSLHTLVANAVSSCVTSGLWLKLAAITLYKLECKLDTIQGQESTPTDFEQRFGVSALQVRTWLLQEGKHSHEATNVLRQLVRPQHQPKNREYKLLLAAVCYWKLRSKGPIISTNAGIADYLHTSEDILNQCLNKAQTMVDKEKEQMKDRRASVGPPPEPELEEYLADVFLQKTQQGQLPTRDWLMEEGKRWFEQAKPDRVFVDPVTGTKGYRNFNFSAAWLDKFRVRKSLDFTRKRRPTLSKQSGKKARRPTGTRMERLDTMTPQARRESILATNNAVQMALPQRKPSAVAYFKHEEP